MANLKAIRIRINSVKSTRQITSAMKMVAAAKLRKAQDKLIRLRPYADKLHEILQGLSQSLAGVEGSDNIYGRNSSIEKVLIVVVTSNKGLCGAFNSNVIKEAKRLVAEVYPEQFKKGYVSFLTIGKKGTDAFKSLKMKMLPEKNELVADCSYETVMGVADNLMKAFANKEFDRIDIVYNQFKNTAVQKLTTEQFLPIQASSSSDTANVAIADYIYEPSQEEIVKELIPKSLKIQFYKAVLDSFVAENGARMTAMHMATDNASTLLQDLTLQYNKARQAAITNQILEVVSGAEALQG